MVTGREPGTQWKILATAWFSCLFVGFELPATQQCWLCAWGFYRLSVIQPRTVIDNHSALMRDQWDSNLQKKKPLWLECESCDLGPVWFWVVCCCLEFEVGPVAMMQLRAEELGRAVFMREMGIWMPHWSILGVMNSYWFRFVLPPWQLIPIQTNLWSKYGFCYQKLTEFQNLSINFSSVIFLHTSRMTKEAKRFFLSIEIFLECPLHPNKHFASEVWRWIERENLKQPEKMLC